MAQERHWEAQGPFAFALDGGADGKITLQDVGLLKVKQIVKISAIGQPNQRLQIKRVISPTQLIVGPADNDFKTKTDLSSYLVADGAAIFFNGDSKNTPKVEDIWKAVYEQEPTVALRSHLVDQYGNPWRTENPLPVKLSDGSVNIGTVNAELEVQLSRQDGSPDSGDVHDSVRIGNQNYELSFTTNDDESKVGADVVALNRLIDVPHDDIEITQFTANGDPEIIEFRENNTLKLTLNLTYNSHGELQRVQRSKP